MGTRSKASRDQSMLNKLQLFGKSNISKEKKPCYILYWLMKSCKLVIRRYRLIPHLSQTNFSMSLSTSFAKSKHDMFAMSWYQLVVHISFAFFPHQQSLLSPEWKELPILYMTLHGSVSDLFCFSTSSTLAHWSITSTSTTRTSSTNCESFSSLCVTR